MGGISMPALSALAVPQFGIVRCHPIKLERRKRFGRARHGRKGCAMRADVTYNRTTRIDTQDQERKATARATALPSPRDDPVGRDRSPAHRSNACHSPRPRWILVVFPPLVDPAASAPHQGGPGLISAQISARIRRRDQMRAQDLMSHPAITCHVNDDLNVPAKLMWDHDCGAIIVVRDDGKLAGVITDRDICMAAFTQGRSLDQILVNAVMAKHVISAHPDHKLGEVERLMAEHQVRRIPVVDEDNRPLGVLSLNDLALESVEPDTRMKDGASKVAHTLAAVCRPRVAKKVAA
jgi:CBS domain-containing protein